jgi:predicted nicotinamide N-methyase
MQIAGYEAELRPIDLRIFREREGAERGGTPNEIDLYCVANMSALVNREELLRAASPEEPPYWALPWIGARVIAAKFRAAPPPSEARVLDLGCGLGLAGVAAGGTAHVTFADNVPAALAFAAANARLHELRNFATTCVDFTGNERMEPFDLIAAADVVYDPAAYAPLCDFLDSHLTAGGILLLTESLRADARGVIDMLARRGIAGTCDAVWVVDEGRPERTWLHILTRITPA